MADGAVNFLLDKLTTIILQNASLLEDVHDEIEEIRNELESMRSFLRDAERSKEKSESIEAWVRQVREVAYEIEDLIDEFMHHKARQQNHKNGIKNLINGVLIFPQKVVSNHQFSSKLLKIKATVQEISERSKRYGFDRTDDGFRDLIRSKSQHYYRESHTFSDEEEIVGMEESTQRLLGSLMEGETRRTIISVVGMGGLGKTTLVSRVFNNQIINKHFDCCAWISVSQTYGVSEILRSIIREVFGGLNKTTTVTVPLNFGSMNYRQLIELLIDYLHQKRYVIVLDDVWSIDFWSEIRAAFPNNKKGSRIILTSRNENIASSVGVGSRVHQLEPLQEKDAMTLFCKKAFWDDQGHRCPNDLEPLAQAILRKCEGLPLAIVAVGGLMCSRDKTVVEWKKVYKSLNWQLNYNPMLGQMKTIMLLSYNDLPFYLKHCFLYCCVFKDGHPIKRKNLLRLWVAEGFVAERKGMTVEEVAEDYLRELVLRSMIQVTETNDAGRVKTCHVHDVMRELAKTTSEKENFCASIHGHKPKLAGKTLHLSVYNRGENMRFSRTMSRHLRSFFVFETDTSSSSSFSINALLPKFNFLRVLDLHGVPIDTIPSSLANLFNLRYLNLRGTRIRELPKSLGRLCQLQTLDVRRTLMARLPNGMAKLKNLRHLYINCNIDQSSISAISPQSTQVPGGLKCIQSLQTLVCIEADPRLLQEIGCLTELKRLEVTKLKATDGAKLCTAIQELRGLYRLGIAAIKDEQLQLDNLTLPPMFLQKLTLMGKLERLPHWISSLENITHLHLGSSLLKEKALESLQALPSLVSLELNKAYDGKCLHFKNGSYPRLNKLKILDLRNLDSLSFEEGAMSNLRNMHLIRCQELKVIPSGIEYLTSLQQLYLGDMPDHFVRMTRNSFQEDDSKLRHIGTIELACPLGQSQILETLC